VRPLPRLAQVEVLGVDAVAPEQPPDRADVQSPAVADAERAQREWMRGVALVKCDRLEARADANHELAPACDPEPFARVDRHRAHGRQWLVHHDAPVPADLEQASLLRRAPGGAAGVDCEAEHAIGPQRARRGEAERRDAVGAEEAQRAVVAGDDPARHGLRERRHLVVGQALARVVGEEAPASDAAQAAQARDPEAAFAVGEERRGAVAHEAVQLAERPRPGLARLEHEERAGSPEIEASATVHSATPGTKPGAMASGTSARTPSRRRRAGPGPSA
jgi:hypothetical protein